MAVRQETWAGPARVLAFGVGAASAVGLWMLVVVGGRECSGPGPARLWVADRDGGRIVGLDGDLFVSEVASLTRPVAVAAAGGGELWCVAARGSGPDGPHDLLALRGGLEVPLHGRPLGLAAGRRRAFALVEGPSEAEVYSFAPGRAAHLLARVRDGTCIAARGDEVVVGDSGGGVSLLDRRGVRRVVLGGRVLEVAAGAAPSWWALMEGEEVRLVRLAEDLRVRWVFPTGLEEVTLAVAVGGDSAWLVGGRARRALLVGPDGCLALDVDELPMAGLVAGAAADDGGLLLLAPGAVLSMDATGRITGGQGGFSFLVGAALSGPTPLEGAPPAALGPGGS